MCRAVGAFLLLGLGAVLCVPLKDAQMVDMRGDTALVESTVREARQAPEHIEELLQPGVKNAFIRTFGDKAGTKGDIHGFSKKLNDRANEGYNHFDSFHKKDADKYGYEVHSQFGKSDKTKVDVSNKKENAKDAEEDKKAAQESKTLYHISGESKDDKKNKNFLDDFDFVYFGDNSGISKFANGEDGTDNDEKTASGSGKSESYETNESYESGGGRSYDSGDKDGGHKTSKSGSYSSGYGDGKSSSYGGEEGGKYEEH